MARRLLLALWVLALLAGCAGQPAAAPPPTPDQIVEKFKAAGLEADGPRVLTKDDYGMAPYVGSGVRFLIPSLGADKGGRVFVVTDAQERANLVKYYTELGKSSAMLFSWVFESGPVVVQINGDLPEATARKYEAALK